MIFHYQGFVENEVHLNDRHSCKQDCKFYGNSTVYRCSSNQFCARQHSCNGEIMNCQFIESDMSVCQSVSSRSILDNKIYEMDTNSM